MLFALAFAGHISGQSSPVVSPIPPSAAHVFQTDDYRIEIDTVAEDIGMLADADLTGYTCYRLFVTTSSPDDQLSAVFGNIDAPAALLTTGDFFQSFPIGDVTASGIVPTVWPSFPSNQYDSFVTIGLDQPGEAPASIDDPGLDDGAGRASLETLRTGSTGVGHGFGVIRGNNGVGEHGAQHDE